MGDESIKDPNYRENPATDYAKFGQYTRNLEMFKRTKKILHPDPRSMYEYVKNVCIDHAKNHPQYPKWIWKPKICDVGCGGGFGANIMSQEADFVWGIDADAESIAFASELFTRNKNNIYYTPQLTFEVINVLDEPREIMPFDIVTCIEVIEHIDDYQKVLNFLKRLCKKDKTGKFIEPPDATLVYISSPNRNSPKILKDHPRNKFHIREWTPEELYIILEKNFKYVTLMNQKGELQDFNTQSDIIFFKCEMPIL